MRPVHAHEASGPQVNLHESLVQWIHSRIYYPKPWVGHGVDSAMPMVNPWFFHGWPPLPEAMGSEELNLPVYPSF
jgi:hypothetical protein